MKNFLLALFITTVFQFDSYGASVFCENEHTEGLPGYYSVTLSLFTKPGEAFRGVDAKFTGPMNQLLAAGMDTPFGNFNAFIDEHQDSQFLFDGNELGFLAIGANESSNHLKAAISGLALLDPPLPNPTRFARLVLPGVSDPYGNINIGLDLHMNLAFDIGLPEPLRIEGILGELCIPEPTTLMLTNFGLVLLCGFRRR